MPSCSNSSNISSAITALNVVQGGSRLLAEIPFVSGLTAGTVIRYDVPTSGWTASKADNAANSEVFGVIESYDSTIAKYQAIIYGSINISTSLLADMGSGGGSGGNDIYFLSGVTAGKLQNLAPTDLTNIVKPVYQVAPHGSYSGVVINYLGYRIGGDIEASIIDEDLGNLQIVIGDNQFTEGYVDCSISHELPISDYPEFYQKYGTQYGYVEKLTLNDTPGGSVVSGVTVTQSGNPSYQGIITNVDYGNKFIYVYKLPGSPQASTAQNLVINLATSISYSLAAASIYASQSPIVRLPEPLIIEGKNTADIVSQTIKLGIKVKPQGIVVSVPQKVTVNSLTATTITLGTGASDLEGILNNYSSRIEAIEDILGI
jgi:hypothetical protein